MTSITISMPPQLGFLHEDDDDGGDDKQQQTGLSPGLLARAETSDFNDWDGGVAGGHNPVWLFPPNAKDGEQGHLCTQCGTVLCFLVQIYAPLNEVDDAFHRDLCLFVCPQCSHAQCYRFQMREDNEFYDDFDVLPDRSAWGAKWPNCAQPISDIGKALMVVEEEVKKEGDVVSSDEEDDDEDEDGEEEAPGVKHHCEVCKAECTMHCTACKQAYYCSVEHQREDWKPRHRKLCGQLADATLTQRDMDKAAADGDISRFNKLTAGKDREFARFTRRTRNAPDQVLRYQRGVSDDVALWISSKNKLTTPPPACEHCGAEREFEFQLLPQFLHFFPQAAAGGKVDFGTICVYTCTRSCGGSQVQRQEYAYLQPEEQV